MKKAKTAYIVVGKIGTSYGVNGWLKIHTYTEHNTDILNYQPWFLSENKDQWKSIRHKDGRLQGKTIVVKLAGISSPEQARSLTGKLIAITRSQLPILPENEYYWSDLQGLTVINQQNEVLGTVSHLIATGSNDVLIVKGLKEQAIPFLRGSVIMKVDLNKEEILVNWHTL